MHIYSPNVFVAKEGNEVKTAMLLQSTYVDNRTLQETITRLLYLESQNQQLLEQVNIYFKCWVFDNW